MLNEAPLLKSDSSQSTIGNKDLQPVDPAARTWRLSHYLALWVSMCICIPSYMITSSLIQGGMNALQALITVLIGNLIVLIPILLNGQVGVRYGIPFPIYARLSFGIKGAAFPAFLRAMVACGWFGIQCWIGGSAIFKILSLLWPQATTVPAYLPDGFGVKLLPFLCFLLFWALNIYLIQRGIESIKRLEIFCAPVLLVSSLLLLAWAFQHTQGLTGIFHLPSKFQTQAEFLQFFIPSLTSVIGYWATLCVNIPDFTRYARSQKDQFLGQIIGLPASMTFIALISIAATTASLILWGTPIWDPVVLVSKFDNPYIVVGAMSIIALATLTMNVTANVVAPANDFTNLAPRYINFKRGGLLAALIGLLIMPWRLVADPAGYIFTWLIGCSAILGSVAGILLMDYYWVKRSTISVPDLFCPDSQYRYWHGCNPNAFAALGIGVAPSIPGFLVHLGLSARTDFPAFLVNCYDYAWFLGLTLSGISYALLMNLWQPTQDALIDSVQLSTEEIHE